MRRRRLLIAAVVIAAVVLLGVFVIIPFIQDTFTPPIVGLPTATSGGTSLQARYTQTALAKQPAATGSETPTPAAKKAP